MTIFMKDEHYPINGFDDNGITCKGPAYVAPGVQVFPCSLEGCLCVSPEDGESEDVEYEDWN